MSTTFPGGYHREIIAAPQKGFLAPEITLEELNGESITLSDFRGKPVIVNLWASWCTPCLLEMPAMERIYQEYKDKGLVIFAVNTTFQDNIAEVKVFIEEKNLTFPVLLDYDGNTAKRYQLIALPSSYFIDTKGIIQEVVLGGPMAEALLRTRVEKMIMEGP